MLNQRLKLFFAVLALIFSAQAFAQTVSDDFTQAVDTNQWVPMYDACLTAGTVANNNTSNSTIPGCNYSTPDPVGSGALRLTPASGGQHGAIVSTYTFPSNQGLQVTFTTYSYGGSANGLAADGADGMGFFLMDGSVGTAVGGGPNLGSWGGSLGYSCSNSNSPYTGLTGAYLGLGMDEWGNFLNSGDNTSTGTPVQISSSSSSNGYNSFASSPYQQANRIGLRGAGNVSWYWLNTNYPNYYPSSLSGSNQRAAVQQTCKTGTLWNYGGPQSKLIAGLSNSGTILTVTVPGNGYSNGDSVTLNGITATPQTQVITATSFSGTTLTLTVPNHGYSNGQQIVIGGTITATAATYSPATITGITGYNSGPKMTVTANNNFSAGDQVTISGGITDSRGTTVTGSYIIQSANSTSFVVWLGQRPCSGGGSNTCTFTLTGSPTATDTTTPTAPTIPGTYTVSSATANTFQVTLSSVPGSITNTSGTTSDVAPVINGTYPISNVTATTFQVTLSSIPGSMTYSSTAAATDQTQSGIVNTGTTVMNYSAIAGGYWVLPDATKIANEASGATRATSWPITYKLQITPAGLLTYMYSYNGGAYQQVLTNFPITTGNGPIPSTFRFGFTGSTGGATNVHEITCFLAEPSQSSSSAGANTVQSGQVRIGTQLYLASYNPTNWWGSLVSDAIYSSSSGAVTIATAADWDGNCVLTGGACPNMGSTSTVSVEPPTSRQLLTWSGTAGIPLEWTSLTSAQTTLLNSTDSLGTDRLDWLRGGRGYEQTATPAGPLRARGGVLGDIIDSSPTWVGAPAMQYASPFTDTLYAGATSTAPENQSGAQTYTTFSNTMATRTHVVYSGSNDGLLHGFRAGSNYANGSYNSTNNDGYEVIGYMPSNVFANANVVGLTSPTYGHNYFVDAPPGFGDLFYNNAWHTWLVGGMGLGGAEIYTLDITDPTQFTESNAATLVTGDWTPSTVTCVGNSGCGANMGNTYGIPLIRRLHNGNWAIIFGNGYSDASTGTGNFHAGVFVGLINPLSAAVTFYYLDTGATGTISNPNGIAYVSSADLDGDHVTDYLYAGDLQGNVWRFDLTSSNPASWGVSTFGQTSPAALFTAKDSLGNIQPITTKIAVSATTAGNGLRVILGFGTGQATEAVASGGITYASGTQTVYGIWDWDMALWNSVSPVKYAALAEPVSPAAPITFTRSALYVDTLASQTATYRTLGVTDVCWDGSTFCPTSNNSSTTNNQFGWLFDLPSGGEQIIYNPIFAGGELVVNTTIPPPTTVTQCIQTLPTGWLMAFNTASGGGAPQNVFPDVSGNFALSGGASIIGMNINGVGTPLLIANGSSENLISQTGNGGAMGTKANLQGGITVKLTSWEELR